MIGDKRVLAIIPARGGSKRFPRKNLAALAGKPLISYSIAAALGSKYVDQVVVSSDDDEVLEVSQNFGATTIKRPDELSSDSATTFDAIKHAIDSIQQRYGYVVLLQPTSPLRDQNHIDEAIKLLIDRKADAVISVCKMDHSPLWSNILPDDWDMSHFMRNEIKNKRSQDLPTYHRINGAIYICNTERLLEERSFFIKDKIFAYEMEIKKSVDIDEKIDLLLAECLIGDE